MRRIAAGSDNRQAKNELTMHATHLRTAATTLLSSYMCIRSGEEVLLTTDEGTDERVIRALAAEIAELDARPTVLRNPRLPFQGQLADPHISRPTAQAIAASDVWIDLSFPYFAGSRVHDEAMKAGRVRYLLGGDLKAEGFHRLFGMVDLDRYYDVQRQFYAFIAERGGADCRITNAAGTNVRFRLGKSTRSKPRYADRPGMYVVPGTCSLPLEADTVKGVFVVAASVHEHYELLQSPVEITVDNTIRSLSGGGSSRVFLDRALRRASKGNYGSVIHLTHGLHPAARMTGHSFIEDIRAVGNNAVGLGIPWWLPGGGENHPDTVITEQTVKIDGERFIDAGTIVMPPGLAKAAAELAPRGYGMPAPA